MTSSHGGKATGMVSLVGRRRGARRGGDRQRARSTRCSRRSTRRSSRSSAGIPCSRRTRSRPSPAARTPRAGCWCAAAAPADEGPGALVVSGHGLSTNIIEASIEAYLVAVNKLHGAEIGPASPAYVALAHDGAPLRSPWPPTGSRRSRATASGPRWSRPRREVLDAVAARDGFTIEWLEVVAGGAAIDAYGVGPPDRGPRGGRGAATRCCWAPSAGRAGTTRTPGSGPSRRCSRCAAASSCSPTCARSRRCPALVPSSPVQPELLEGVDLLIVRELTVGPLLRAAVRGARHARGPRRDRHALVHGGRDPARRPARVRAGPRPARPPDERRQGQRPGDLAPVAEGRRGDEARLPGRRGRPPARRLVRDAPRRRPAGVRRARHREPLRRHPVGRGGGPRREPRHAALGVARRAADRARPVRPVRADPRLGAGHRRPGPGQPARRRSCRPRCCCAGRSASRRGAATSRRRSRGARRRAPDRDLLPPRRRARRTAAVVGTARDDRGGRSSGSAPVGACRT